MNPIKIFGDVFGWESGIAIGVFVAVCVAMLVAMVLSHRRRRRGTPASQRPENNPLELTYALSIAGIVGFVVFLSFRATAQENPAHASHTATVNVTGFQWCWRFSYPGQSITVTGTCDGTHMPTMVVPVGEPIKVNVTSDDVIHSWWVPALRYKRDAFPNHVNDFTITIDHAGKWIGRCAEFCGFRHYEMDFYLQAVPPEQYRKWLASGGSNQVLSG
jgi:cytochrome c oxidase subunit 2